MPELCKNQGPSRAEEKTWQRIYYENTMVSLLGEKCAEEYGAHRAQLIERKDNALSSLSHVDIRSKYQLLIFKFLNSSFTT